MQFSHRFALLAASVKALKKRPDATLQNQQKRTISTNVHRQSNKNLDATHKGEESPWEKLSFKGQEEYLRQHPRSRRRITKTPPNHITPRDPEPKDGIKPPPNIVWPTRYELTDKQRADREKEREQALKNIRKHKARGGKVKTNYSKSLMFMNRLVNQAPPLAPPSATKTDRNKALKAFSDFMSKYDKLSAEDFEDEADRHYAAHPNQAKEDGVTVNSDLTSTEAPMSLDDDAVEQEKQIAEQSTTPQNPTILNNIDKQYKTNPFGKLPVAEQRKKIKAATKVLAKGFSADTNSIVAHAYQNLDADQINTLESMAQEASVRSMAAKKKANAPAKRKRLLNIIGVTVMVAAALAFGGPVLGALAFHHSLSLANPDGNLHGVIWNALRGKLANGNNDPDFDPHEDAVEKIVKSLQRQLANTDKDDHDSKEHIQAIIDQLEDSTTHHQLHKEDYVHIPSHVRRITRKPKAKHKRR